MEEEEEKEEVPEEGKEAGKFSYISRNLLLESAQWLIHVGQKWTSYKT